jgi:hypothetical protein
MDFYAVFTVEAVFYEISVGVDLVEHHVGIGFVAGRESDYFIVFRHAFQKADCVGTDGYVSLRG